MECSTELTALEVNLRQHVTALARTPRPPGSAEHRQASSHIRRHLQQAGFTVQDGPFHLGGVDGLNLLTQSVPERSDLPLFIVAAHYDSIPNSPGADDNASAVAALLEVARLLRGFVDGASSWGARLQLVAYDLEEYGLIGSSVHSRELKQSKTALRGMVSLEMLGRSEGRRVGEEGR